ncbi:MAG: hypothetical protein HYT75_04985 [Deltaproteobacteria bacterium]|nr:hypothetical protein [Deltaproteobacteria bacterium]
MAKDLYYAYYMLRFSPNKSETLLKLKQFKILPEWRIAAAAIVKNFSAITSEGVVLVEKEFGQDSIIKNLRKHILETFSMLLKE